MSLMTSYARAKAESLDAKCTVGIAERAERNILIWVSLLISALVSDVMPYALTLLAVLSTSQSSSESCLFESSWCHKLEIAIC
jgi:hypothetical protein